MGVDRLPAAEAARRARMSDRLCAYAEEMAERDFPILLGDDLLADAAIGLEVGGNALSKAKAALRCRSSKARHYDVERPDCRACGGSGWVEDESGAHRCEHAPSPAP